MTYIKAEAQYNDKIIVDVLFDTFNDFFEKLTAEQQSQLCHCVSMNTDHRVTLARHVFRPLTWGILLDFCQSRNLVNLFSTYFPIKKVTKVVAI